MSSENGRKEVVELFASSDEPAIGLIATDQNAQWIAGEIINAQRNGHQAIVTGESDGIWKIHARALDAVCLDHCRSAVPNKRPRERLVSAAKQKGYPGLIFHDDPSTPLDLDRSIEALQSTNDYAINALTEPAIGDSTQVLAGIPAYNEAATIQAVVEEVSEYVQTVLVVDDGSDDQTTELARKAGATVVEHQTNRGYGAALRTIFAEADRGTVDYLVILDADAQHSPADIPTLLKKQQSSDAEIVIGSRFTDDGATNAPVYRKAGLFVVNLLTNLSCGAFTPNAWVRDTQSGFRAYSREVISTLAEDDSISEQMSASTDVLTHAHRHGYRVEEVGTTIDYDVEEASNQHPLFHGYTLVKNIFQTVQTRRPFPVLGVPGFTSWICGLWLGFWVLTSYESTSRLSLGLTFFAGLLTLAGIMACFMAVLMHSFGQSA